MHRLPAAFVVSLLVLVCGCFGSLEETGEPIDLAGPDAGASPAKSDGGVGAAEACDQPVDTMESGNHRPGEPCLSCHTQGGSGPAFTAAGTIFDDLTGTAPAVGATIHLVDADGAELSLVSAQNGNFWTRDPVAYPLTTYASSCPDSAEMVGEVQDGDCNRGGCHTGGFRAALR